IATVIGDFTLGSGADLEIPASTASGSLSASSVDIDGDATLSGGLSILPIREHEVFRKGSTVKIMRNVHSFAPEESISFSSDLESAEETFAPLGNITGEFDQTNSHAGLHYSVIYNPHSVFIQFL